MRICITGGVGFIGSVLVQSLLSQGHVVTVIDDLRLGGHGLLAVYGHPQLKFRKGDINAVFKGDLIGQDVVIHLAALVGEPPCVRFPEEAERVNYVGTLNMLEMAQKVGVQHFLFASTCSNYGKQPGIELDESALLLPLSLYADTKIRAEKMVLAANNANFATTVFRFATAFGVSPRMRFDLLLNEFVRDAFVDRWLVVYGRESFRTLVHVRDIVQFVQLAVEKREETRGEVYNVGSEHISKMGLVNILKKYVPNLEVGYKEQQADPRDYKASFKKALAFGFEPQYSVEDGVIEVMQALKDGLFPDAHSSLYRNVQ